MKNALILHGKSTDSNGNWFPYLKNQLELIGYEVWVPDLPNSRFPNMKDWLETIHSNKAWVLNEQSVVIGHSAGSIAAVQFISELEVQILAGFLVGTFTEELTKADDWRAELEGLFHQPINYEVAKKHAKKFVIVHSPEDPHCPLEQAEAVADKLHGKLVLISGGHFDIDDDKSYTQFPKLLEIIKAQTR